MDPSGIASASAATSPYHAPAAQTPPNTGMGLPPQPMPFDNVYGQRYAGYDTRSTLPLSGAQPTLAEPEAFSNVYNDRHAGYDTRSTVPLGSEAYMNSNYAVPPPENGGIYSGRYAGLSTKSSLTLAHFGGNDAVNLKQSMYQTTSKSTYTPPSHPLALSRASDGPVQPNPFVTRPAYSINNAASPRKSRQERQLMEPRQAVGNSTGGMGLGSAPTLGPGTGATISSGPRSPAGSGHGGGSLKLPPISQEQAEGLIREVARLRVENRELTERLKACSCAVGQSSGF